MLLFAALELAFLATSYSNLFFLLLAFSGVLGVAGAWWSLRNVHAVRSIAVDVAGAAAGDSRRVEVTASTSRSCFDVEFLLRFPGEPAAEAGYAQVLHGDTRIEGQLAARQRGLHAITRMRVRSRFPFGLFVTTLELPVAAEVLTWPAPAAGTAHDVRGGSARDGDHLDAGRGTALAGLRAFRSGDSLADVHWKATARRGTAIVKERERDAAPAQQVVFDRRCSPEAFEQELARITAMVLDARHGPVLRVLSQDVELIVDAERGGARDALRWLATTSTLPPSASAPPRSRFAEAAR